LLLPLCGVFGCAQPSPLKLHEDGGGGMLELEDLAGVDFSGSDLSFAGDLAHNPASCPAGQKDCNGSCINAINCCGAADCPQYANSTATCLVSGMCAYMCNTGFRDCNGTCRSTTLCCKDSDCPSMPMSMTPHCSAQGMCTVGMCNAGWVDFNKDPADGCECQDGGKSAACAQATSLGSVAIGASLNASGNVLVMGDSNWMSVTFASNTDDRYHPHIKFSANPSNQFVFDVVKDCNAATMACGTETGKTANSVTDWEVAKTGGAAASTKPMTAAPVPAVGIGGKVLVRVYRVSGAATCDTYTLAISN
jgi:hypothetical protein